MDAMNAACDVRIAFRFVLRTLRKIEKLKGIDVINLLSVKL